MSEVIYEGVPAPESPHLALKTGDEFIAIPPGATLCIITDPRKINGIMPLVLLKVTQKTLDFHCACGQPGCTRRARFRAEWQGSHKAGKAVAAPDVIKDPAEPAATEPTPEPEEPTAEPAPLPSNTEE